jgi:hypothetical protein
VGCWWHLFQLCFSAQLSICKQTLSETSLERDQTLKEKKKGGAFIILLETVDIALDLFFFLQLL